MDLVRRFALWIFSALAVFAADISTKAAPHHVIAHNGAHTPFVLIVFVSCFLCGLGLWHSRLLALGSGLMFGGLCGNAGQFLLTGYATDWIPIGGWLTNVADISGAVGLVCCFVGYVLSAVQRRAVHQRPFEA